jgi:ABC-type branched-subunit amino acid transport system permease subunit
MVAVGGVGNIGGAVLGALAILGLDRIAIPLLQTQLETQNFIAGFNLRELSFLLFGLALYLSVLGSRGLRWRQLLTRLSEAIRAAFHRPRLSNQH